MWGCSVWGQGFHLNIYLIHWEWLYLAQLAGWSCRMPHKLCGANKQLSYTTEPPSCTWIHAPTRQSFSLHVHKAQVCFVSPEQIQEKSVTMMNALKTFDARTHHQFCQSSSQIHQKDEDRSWLFASLLLECCLFPVSAAGKQTYDCNWFGEKPVEVVQGFGLVHIAVVSIFCCVCVSVAICCIYMCMRIKQDHVYAFCWITSFHINGILSEMSLTWQLTWMWTYYLLFDSPTST